MIKRARLIIVNSCYNPTNGWEHHFIKRAKEYIQCLQDYSCEFVLVDDGSTLDISKEMTLISAELPSFQYYRYKKNRGKGYALRHGISQSKGDYYLYTDIDFPYTAISALNLLKTISGKSANVVLGTREESYFMHIPLQRKLVSKSLIWLNKYILGLKHPDTQCGIKLIDDKAKVQFLNVKVEGFLFEIEFIINSEKHLKVETSVVKLNEEVILKKLSFRSLARLLMEYLKFK